MRTIWRPTSPLDQNRPALQIEVSATMPVLGKNAERRVSEIWERQVILHPKLFNGPVFSVDRIKGQMIFGHWSEYRRIVARIHDPALAMTVRVRPLAVAGIIAGPDGVLFGLRPTDAIYQPGVWQCAPAGNVDRKAIIGNRIDLLEALALELNEELGLSPNSFADADPVIIVQHIGIGIIDVAFRLVTPLSGAVLQAAHGLSGDGEYPEIAIVPVADLPGFLAAEATRMAPQVPLFLQAAGLLHSN